MWRCEIVSLLACLMLACDGEPPGGSVSETALERLPPYPLGEELFDAGYVTFRGGGRKWDLDLWSCVIEKDAGQESGDGCASLGITDGDHVFWLQIATHSALTRFEVETVPHADGSVAARVTADLAEAGSSTIVRKSWLVAEGGQWPQLVSREETAHP
jgi:hypothetical protein